MKKLLLFVVLPMLLVATTVGFGYKSSGGKAGMTGSPSEGTCVQCHNSFALNEGDGSVVLSNAELEANNWEYVGGQTYDMELTISHTGASLFGFDLEVLDANAMDAGTLIVSNGDETQLMNANDRTNLVHKKDAGIGPDTKTFSFQWTAPEDVDAVTFYYSANAADGNSSTSGDYIYNTSQALTRNTSGFINQALQAKIYTYPNPATDVVSVNISEKINDYHIAIFNTVGQLLDTKLEKTFSVADYPKGTYYVIVSDKNNKKLATSNFVKL